MGKDPWSMTVGFLIIATGKYTRFVKPLVDSINSFVLPGVDKAFNVFTDAPWEDEAMNFIAAPHEPWPGPTLHRFRNFLGAWDRILGDQLVYVDADTRFVAPAGGEILGECVAVRHCGFVGSRGSYETRPESACFVGDGEGSEYYGGGFYSLSRERARTAFEACAAMIDADEAKGVVPVWHDESAWNRFLIDEPPSAVLSPSYHYPENHPYIYGKWASAGTRFDPVLLLLSKDHDEMRS
jgi:histo-blood group ABO system transferase